jgi:sugar phosphate isomerase/epimerase
MVAPIGLQLYTLRDAIAADFEGTVRKVADIGYLGVEPAGFTGTTPQAAARLFEDLGLEVISAHLPLPDGDDNQQALEAAQALGILRWVSGLGPDNFSSRDQIAASCERFNKAGAFAREHGMSFGIHNHWWEFLEVEGRLVYQVIEEHVSPDIFFQIDAYWVQTAGQNPAAVMKELGNRAPLIHLKDGPCTRDTDMMALGEGITDFDAIVAAGADDTQWWIVELDRCATDMMEAVTTSLRYLADSGYGRAR